MPAPALADPAPPLLLAKYSTSGARPACHAVGLCPVTGCWDCGALIVAMNPAPCFDSSQPEKAPRWRKLLPP